MEKLNRTPGEGEALEIRVSTFSPYLEFPSIHLSAHSINMYAYICIMYIIYK
jgi:hypothetical protein